MPWFLLLFTATAAAASISTNAKSFCSVALVIWPCDLIAKSAIFVVAAVGRAAFRMCPPYCTTFWCNLRKFCRQCCTACKSSMEFLNCSHLLT